MRSEFMLGGENQQQLKKPHCKVYFKKIESEVMDQHRIIDVEKRLKYLN